MVRAPRHDPNRGLYAISVAADLVGSLPQNLRVYEARGLLAPTRSEGGTRRYSENDLQRLRDIGRLLEAGLNLAGIGMVLELQATNKRLRRELEQARMELAGQHVRETGSAPTRRVRPSRRAGSKQSSPEATG